MTKTVVFAGFQQGPENRRPDFSPMKPRKGFTYASREIWDAWIHSEADSSPELVYRPGLSLFTSSMVLAVLVDGKCVVPRGYEAVDGDAPIANEIARERLALRHHETQTHKRPVANKEMIEKAGRFAALDSLLLPQKGGGWCIAVIDIRLLLPIPVGDMHADETDHGILQALYRGLSAKEIAQQVELSHRTIEHRIERMKAKTGARTIPQLVALTIASQLMGKASPS
ncbi:hypothetical protein CO660_05415 [Rhizobium sp. L9]|uniref:helix-turn-helix transcriptional regulator n=1 Tax=Rhizobium sp. L9 TaxID=1340738 RepID=UPI000BEA6FDB|nr:helix-turn-helix transcriptional regulator [Rhizobium sp. L9]PDT30781.1 hypothetical protein CO660_05415 [Rhizobium sp. L9]